MSDEVTLTVGEQKRLFVTPAMAAQAQVSLSSWPTIGVPGRQRPMPSSLSDRSAASVSSAFSPESNPANVRFAGSQARLLWRAFHSGNLLVPD